MQKIFPIATITKTHKSQIDELLGQAPSRLTIWNRNKGKGIFNVYTCSANFNTFFGEEKPTYVEIEARSKGIWLSIKSPSQEIGWAIPYYQLVIYKTGVFSIHAQGQYVKVSCDTWFQVNAAFIINMMELKTIATQNHQLPYDNY
jgi:hypothetical protein